MSSIVYQIPLSQLAGFRGRPLIVRSDHPHHLVAHLRESDLANLAYVQLCGLSSDTDVLLHWAEGMPIDLLLDNPAQDFASLYSFAKLLDNHPVRITLPVETGFENAVKLASSLQFDVKLQIGQPRTTLIESLERVLDDYLHSTTVTQPIEFFHSLLLGFCNNDSVNLWAIQEEDPAFFRNVDEQGRERLPGRLSISESGPTPENFVTEWGKGLLAEGAECTDCPFFAPCRGYFKWPIRDYDCAGVKGLLTSLQQAASELREDIAAASPNGGASP